MSSDASVPRRQDAEVPATEMASGVELSGVMPALTGGVYIPPFKLKKMLEEAKQAEGNHQGQSVAAKRLEQEQLRKAINGIVNKVNVANIKEVTANLFEMDLVRGRGLLAKAIMKAQAASTNFTNVFAALIAIINTKLPELVKVIVHRVLLQFKRAYKRNNRIQCISSLKMIAHLINQQVVDELIALQLLSLFLENPTEDSIDVATDFMLECGQVLSDVSPAGVNAIFDRFR